LTRKLAPLRAPGEAGIQSTMTNLPVSDDEVEIGGWGDLH
jgi:hypothetical protein